MQMRIWAGYFSHCGSLRTEVVTLVVHMLIKDVCCESVCFKSFDPSHVNEAYIYVCSVTVMDLCIVVVYHLRKQNDEKAIHHKHFASHACNMYENDGPFQRPDGICTIGIIY